jgi:pseudouridine-5'-phosphate glycosidase
MLNQLPKSFALSKELIQARQIQTPVVALESAVITHGLPRPENLNLARGMEGVVRKNGALPATIALFEGKIHIGMTDTAIEVLSNLDDVHKISLRDMGLAIAKGWSGGTTVAATLFAASQVGIRVFATGGIGGVHRGAPFDVSADLQQLGKSSLIVVCAGAKSILDLPATREVLETQGVPVIGYQTDEFPAFYSRESGILVDQRVETPEEVVQIALASWGAGLQTAILLVAPPPAETALPADLVEAAIETALEEAEKAEICGSMMTPFLLGRVSHLTGGESLNANIALLRNNAKIAAQVAVAYQKIKKRKPI